jgi:NADH-quinone oxidoreductase subunit E
MPVLTEELREKIKAYLPRYPSKQAATLPALHLVQDALRCVPLEAVREIADLLDLSPAEVHDTMSFYGIFRDEKHPLGKTRLCLDKVDSLLDELRK